MQTSDARVPAEPASAPSMQQESDLFRLVADSAPVMMWMAGPDRQFEWFNRPWLEYTGRSMEQERGAGWLDGVHIEDLERCAGIYHASFDARQRFTMDFRLRRHDGQYRWFMATGVPREAPDGGFHGYTGTCVDIHERKELEERLAERTRALRLADRRKDEFLAMLAHDLRNPLGPITNAVAMMKAMEGESPAVAPLRQIIERQLEQLKRVIADMRDVTRVTQARAVELHKETLAVDQLVRLAVEAAQPALQERGHELKIDLPAAPCAVWGDASRLSQALSHLLGNAAKFSPAPGAIELRATCDGTTVRVHVRDHGQGISPDFMPQMFEPFAQESHSTPRTNHGLGVGLTIAKRLAELHGGDVTGTSEGPGRGAEFVLSLPQMQQPA
ncbi:MAG TPA: PAS domain-containing sensor histidine kinase [Albitalea sp.]